MSAVTFAPSDKGTITHPPGECARFMDRTLHQDVVVAGSLDLDEPHAPLRARRIRRVAAGCQGAMIARTPAG